MAIGIKASRVRRSWLGWGYAAMRRVDPISSSLHGIFWGRDRLDPKLPAGAVAKESERIDGPGHKATQWNI